MESQKFYFKSKLAIIALKHRTYSLAIAGVLGMFFSWGGVFIFDSSSYFDRYDYFKNSCLFLALPVFFLLWIFPTNDTREQIKKTQESIHNSTLFNSLALLAQDSLVAKVIALKQLIYLKNKIGVYRIKLTILQDI